MFSLNFWLLIDWITIMVNIWSISFHWRQSRLYGRRLDEANRRIGIASAARLESMRLLGIMLNAPGDSDVYRFALVRLMDDDLVADRTKDAIVRHLKDLGIGIEPEWVVH